MPRDLLADRNTLDAMPPLSKEPAASSPPPEEPTPFYRVPSMLIEDRFKRIKDLRPFPLLLSSDDLDDCDWLEHAAFAPHEAASREKVRFAYSSSSCHTLFPCLPCCVCNHWAAVRRHTVALVVRCPWLPLSSPALPGTPSLRD